MNPKEILANVVSAASGKNGDRESIIAELEKTGIAKEIAEQAFVFVQIAWGRSFLDGLGITFSEQYFSFDANGSFVESGNLKDNPYFTLATSIAHNYKDSLAFERLALSSAELDAVNQALNNGSESHNLVTGPACVFLAPPTAKGIEKAQSLVAKKLQRENPPKTLNKSRWRFWE